MRILAIDPGPTECGYVVLEDGKPTECEVVSTSSGVCHDIRDVVEFYCGEPGKTHVACEMVASYGMPVGIEVFETVYWTGRLCEIGAAYDDCKSVRIYRSTVKHHLCGSSKAKDANVRQALIDRFGPGRELAVGTKKNPGPLYGISSHCWAALALAVTYQDLGEACCVDPAREMAAKSARRQLKREKRKAKEVSK